MLKMMEGVQDMKNRVKISIDGKSFTLMGEETEEHMRQVAMYIDQKMTEVRQKAFAVTLDASLAYVLTSINVADDYFKEKAYTAELEGRIAGMAARTKELTDKIEEMEAKKAEEDLAAKLQELEEKLELSEKARVEAENKLDDYMMAMEGSQQNAARHTSNHTTKNKSGKR